ncbi:hypothetical protein ENUP19_0014G0033 [Entamoeba nuttalli]|uniref:Uncharacterized protein n=2 Tax=Entamoeba nuttalli TaxID=412467 RepID=K2H597_ENTNP|nr:hypothetical protein ENU1_011980 [Entamoeba nuttalli P19]EKE42733.1 hypothetical protein ENU1_011980 [Entamoeba nuttalli P19]|eukprot:XP_008854933.1 hypothetical protein ENU1_011980 [Entamoeba nuttalli P19]
MITILLFISLCFAAKQIEPKQVTPKKIKEVQSINMSEFGYYNFDQKKVKKALNEIKKPKIPPMIPIVAQPPIIPVVPVQSSITITEIQPQPRFVQAYPTLML